MHLFSPGKDVAASLREIRASVLRLVELMEPAAASIREVLDHLRQFGLFTFDQRYQRALDLILDESDESADHTSVGGPTAATRPAATEVGESEEEQGGGSASSDAAVLAFLGCGAAEMWPYRRYVAAESPFATQHGVKGAEFDRVLVVMDEEESDFNLYNYEKYFGITPLSSNDQKKIDAGEDNILARTRRLLYVCCTRAKRDLVLVLFTTDESSAREKVKSSGLMPEDSIMSSDSFAAMST